MKNLKLVKPEEILEEEFQNYIAEWALHNEKLVPYAARINSGRSFEEWLEETRALEHHSSEGMVTASLWFLVKGERIIGAITLRHELNDRPE